MNYAINVTEQDIAVGEQRSCRHCPISVAIGRISGAISVSTDEECIRVGSNDVIPSDHYATPCAAAEFIRAFDTGNPVEPFTFELKSIT